MDGCVYEKGDILIAEHTVHIKSKAKIPAQPCKVGALINIILTS